MAAIRRLLCESFWLYRKILLSVEADGEILLNKYKKTGMFTVTRKFDPKETIELDRFVHSLRGDTREVINRHSGQVASTMKQEHGMTINRWDWSAPSQCNQTFPKNGSNDKRLPDNRFIICPGYILWTATSLVNTEVPTNNKYLDRKYLKGQLKLERTFNYWSL